MMRRWLIRVPCLVALAFVVGVWMTSYFGDLHISNSSRNHSRNVITIRAVGAVYGLCYLEEVGDVHGPDFPLNFRFKKGESGSNFLPGPRTLGFYRGNWAEMAGTLGIVFPLWLPTGLLAGLLWLVWRKTRPTYNGRGFPVEAAGKEATKP